LSLANNIANWETCFWSMLLIACRKSCQSLKPVANASF
jgi:hypothetical protein